MRALPSPPAARYLSGQEKPVMTVLTDETARLLDTLSGQARDEPFDTLVLTTTPVSDDRLMRDAEANGQPARLIGDAMAPRRASLAFYEGRMLGRLL